MARKKFYVVWKGREPGVYVSWEECAAQVDGYPGAEYKAFDTRPEAEKAFQGAYSDYVAAQRLVQPKLLSEEELRRIGRPIVDSYSVDAACNGSPGVLEYRCVHNRTKAVVFKRGPYADGTNNVGEFLAIVHALALFKRKKITSPVYSDSEVAIDWVESRKCRTKLARTETNAGLFDLIERAEKWLAENDYENRVLKWHTEAWGEIPADYGRK